jgi:hypothetical protein
MQDCESFLIVRTPSELERTAKDRDAIYRGLGPYMIAASAKQIVTPNISSGKKMPF